MSYQGLPAGFTVAEPPKAAPAPFHGLPEGFAVQSGDVPKPNSFVDAIRSIPGGLTKGVAAIAGLPGDLENLVNRGQTALGDKIVRSLGGQPAPNGYAPPSILPTSSDIEGAASAPTGGFYEPKTGVGHLAETAAEFAPSALSPGSAAIRLARVLVPAVASEGAGAATKGTQAEPYARAAAALLGGGLVETGRNIPEALANSRTIAAVPSSQDLRAAATNAYQRAADAGVVINQGAVQRTAADLGNRLADAGIDPTLHPRAVAAHGRLAGAGAEGDQTLNQMDTLRRVAGAAAGSTDADERRLGRMIIGHIDDFVQNLSPADVAAGDSPTATQALTDARGLWARQAKGGQLDNLIDRAQTRAETVGGSGLENALRVQFRQLAMSDARMRGFTPEEQDAIRTVARGGPIGNAMHLVGKLAPTHAITALGEMGAVAANPMALAIPAAGMAGRIGATAATMRNARMASALARNGAPLQLMQPNVSRAALLSQLLASQANSSQ